jgi:6-phosphogluconolactonase (cycloisomerase 2 family)
MVCVGVLASCGGSDSSTPAQVAVPNVVGSTQSAVTANGPTSISAFKVNSSTGVLTPAAGSPFATGTNPYSVSIDPTGQFVDVGNDGSSNVSEFTLDGTTGVLTGSPGSPVTAGANPDFIAIK